MLQLEFERAWAEAAKAHNANVEQKKATEPNRFYGLPAPEKVDIITYTVLQRLYGRDELDHIPGINGPNRHRVFCDWAIKHRATWEPLVEDAWQAALQAADQFAAAVAVPNFQ